MALPPYPFYINRIFDVSDSIKGLLKPAVVGITVFVAGKRIFPVNAFGFCIDYKMSIRFCIAIEV